MQRHFSVDRPDLLWVADITDVATGTGFPPLVVVIDVFNRRVRRLDHGSPFQDRNRPLQAFNMARKQRQPLPTHPIKRVKCPGVAGLVDGYQFERPLKGQAFTTFGTALP